MNVKEIFEFKRPEKSFYDILGCDISSSIEQINREYKIKALQFHPDKNSDPESLEVFKQLQLAKEILLDAKERKTYDSWLTSGLNIPFEQFRQRQVHHSMHWASPRLNNLSIQNAINKGQGSDNEQQTTKTTKTTTKINNHQMKQDDLMIDCQRTAKQQNVGPDWLTKFRRYEV